MNCKLNRTNNTHPKHSHLNEYRCSRCARALWAADQPTLTDCPNVGFVEKTGVRLKAAIDAFTADPDAPASKLPSVTQRAWNLAEAIGQFVKEPGFVTGEEYQARLKICESCPLRQEGNCTACGCYIAAKARGAAWHCPKSKWPGDPPQPKPENFDIDALTNSFSESQDDLVSPMKYRERLQICGGCEKRDGGKCTECGCKLASMCQSQKKECPINKW
jgi:hypothetical protein